MDPLGNGTNDWERKLSDTSRMGHPNYLIIKSFYCKLFLFLTITLVVSIHMGDKISCCMPSGRCMYTSFLDFLVTNFPIVILPCPWPPSQTVTHSPCINADPYLWSYFLPGKMNNQRHCSKLCPVGGFLFTTVLQGYPRKGLEGCSCTFWGSACTLCSKPEFFFFPS